jgi:hypothetical protein
MVRILILTLLLHVFLNGMLSAAYMTLLDDETRQAMQAEIEKVKGFL